ncbi:MAG: putative ABC transporter permease [Mogibacterium sp.]|nr:putative ABC transporter permease [Mogibacterium sp.]
MAERLQKAIIWFTLYAVFGWCYEVFLEVVVYRWGFTNRGVLFGPYCPVYGFGALALVALVYPLIRGRDLKDKLIRIPAVFLLSMLIATALELATSYILEWATGSWPWQTYAEYAWNFQARIALSPSLRFGLGGLIFLYLLQPLWERLCDRLGRRGVKLLSCALICIFAVDCLYTFLIK